MRARNEREIIRVDSGSDSDSKQQHQRQAVTTTTSTATTQKAGSAHTVRPAIRTPESSDFDSEEEVEEEEEKWSRKTDASPSQSMLDSLF